MFFFLCTIFCFFFFFFFSSRRRHTRLQGDWSSDVCSSDLVQGPIISPSNPRRLYFNDSVAVGIVGGGFIELAAQDPERGMNFYMLLQQPGDKPLIIERDECL